MVPRGPLEHPSNGVTPNVATAGTWGPGSPHDPSGSALALRESSGFQMKQNVSNLLKIRALTPALPVSGYRSLPRKRRPRRAQLTRKVKELEASSLVNEQNFCQWTEPLHAVTVPTLGMGDLKAFCMLWEIFQDIPSACDVCTCERGLWCWKGLFKYLYSPSLLVSCPQMRSS